jgi:hypothetical protein
MERRIRENRGERNEGTRISLFFPENYFAERGARRSFLDKLAHENGFDPLVCCPRFFLFVKKPKQ